MPNLFQVSSGDEIIILAKGWFTEDASYFDTEKLEIKISKSTKRRLVFAQQECVKHGWWAIEVHMNDKDDVRYLDEEGNEDPDYRPDIEYYRVTSDSMVFHSQHKHNPGAEIESEMFNLEGQSKYDEKLYLKIKANEFIKKCNVFSGVHAIEGGVVELDSLLADFILFLKN
jgi:hypothetical protein